jgi:hypothetical protein
MRSFSIHGVASSQVAVYAEAHEPRGLIKDVSSGKAGVPEDCHLRPTLAAQRRQNHGYISGSRLVPRSE